MTTKTKTTRTNVSHKDCTHAHTKTARAACRRRRLAEATEKVVDHTFTFVRKARAEGYANVIKEVTFYEIAQEFRIGDFDLALAKRLARERAEKMDENDLLGEDVRPIKEIK